MRPAGSRLIERLEELDGSHAVDVEHDLLVCLGEVAALGRGLNRGSSSRSNGLDQARLKRT